MTFSPLFRLMAVLLMMAALAACKPKPETASVEGANLRQAGGPVFGSGMISGDLYQHPFLQLELPILQGWHLADRAPLEAALQLWDPANGLDSLPSLFLMSVGRILPEGVVGIGSSYFLQVEAQSRYPDLAGNPATYLAAVGEQLALAGQQVLGEVKTDTIDQRQVYRLDIGFQFGEIPGKQTYYSWTQDRLFVNLVFTYANDQDWNLLQTQVLDLTHLQASAQP